MVGELEVFRYGSDPGKENGLIVAIAKLTGERVLAWGISKEVNRFYEPMAIKLQCSEEEIARRLAEPIPELPLLQALQRTERLSHTAQLHLERRRGVKKEPLPQTG